ncbi:hypothetical protein L313_2798 [Acinetobacter haemolyticus CIP 64.3 = MTCC 9819]|uniref:Uncharacterized protein n=1 Tax=Acinetobacter haemolyticus CIP 64.3 = MTCC 9819 TaxID=1217659 RepID=N9G7Z7_ACIHA|nr:hypothetical protein [Acinetobacter haemolyticus]ENW15615.1 hypothetical protein F927_03355 [Acinetobacter haemolyticus CIP 64.3 = MTCC 9819]EPR90388.1 hypothetical protein L313_2798 [Acinetobacter haemolyticus CIP 64.3 = MTCC 9819]QXZ26472.1 hypothetical protein I6L22_15080 [Acinetobacter haemolyticus]SPT48662.1 Uncharacterised protein [Acinetobacter haemolyticus]SUU61822.1 Uncharacterised protein [Acinetobacter haemolyticus]
MRSEFENSIKWSASYEKLVYQHGERLFIFDDGKYKIAAVQLAWEIFKEQQSKVGELHKISVALNTETIRQREQVAHYLVKNAELQKRVDAAINAINEHYESDGMSGLMFIDLREILLGEQALKGGCHE